MYNSENFNIWVEVMKENDPDTVVDLLGISSETLMDVFREEAEQYYRTEIQGVDDEEEL